MTTIETREQAWVQLHDAMHDQLNLPRKDWPEDLEETIAEANRFLDENPPPQDGAPEPVQIVLSHQSLGQIRDVMDDYLSPLKERVDRLTGAFDLITRMADAREVWLAILGFDTIIKADGSEVTLTDAETAYLRSILGDILMYSGREDYLTAHLGPAPEVEAPTPVVATPPMPAPPAHRPEPGYMLSETEPGVQVAVSPVVPPAAPPAAPRSPLAEARARRSQMPTDMPSPNPAAPQPPGVEVWEGAPPHNCREWLDVDDVCTQCGAVIVPVRPQVYDAPIPGY